MYYILRAIRAYNMIINYDFKTQICISIVYLQKKKNICIDIIVFGLFIIKNSSLELFSNS